MWDCTKCYYCRTYFDVFNMNDKKCLFLSDLLVALKKNILNPVAIKKFLRELQSLTLGIFQWHHCDK